MSSFVINKKEYVKAAGYFAGLADQKDRFNESIIYWWNSKKGGVMEAEDYYKAFCSLYDMNARSVMLQYSLSSVESDADDYRMDFDEYRRKAVNLYNNSVSVAGYADFRDSVFDFLHFCDCIAYQIEDRSLSRQAKHFTYTCQHYLLKLLCSVNHYHSECWGDFTLDKDIEEDIEEDIAED